MQRIERYGVIALVFLLVTILAVSLWGEGGGFGAAAGEGDSEVTAKAEQPAAKERPSTGTVSTRRGKQKAPPISTEAARDQAGAPARNPRDAAGRPSAGGGHRALPTPSTTSASKPAAPAAPAGHLARPPARGTTVATPASSQVQRPSSTSRVYVVRPGETLSEIAQNELGTYRRWTEIQTLNGGLDPAALREGMKLTMPPRDGSVAAAVPPTAPREPAARPAPAKPKVNGHTYVVQRGDVLGVIAQRELGTSKRWQEIVALNPGIDPDRLSVGTRLQMPEGKPRIPQIAQADTSSARTRAIGGQAGGQTSTRGKVR